MCEGLGFSFVQFSSFACKNCINLMTDDRKRFLMLWRGSLLHSCLAGVCIEGEEQS